MSNVTAIALSGMNGATSHLRAAGHNLANQGTDPFHRQLVQQASAPGGGVLTTADRAVTAGSAVEQDMVGLLSAKNAFLVNLAVFRAGDQTTGALLDVFS